MFTIRRPKVLSLSLLCFGCLAANAAAQSGPMTVRVRVTDSANVPVAGAAISLARGLSDVKPEGETDATGVRTFQLDSASGSYEVVIRKIGYRRTSRFVTANTPRASLDVTLHRVVRTLDAVRVTEREDVKRKSYHIDADEIANSPRPLFDGMDILTKLKPDILYGRAPGCGAQNVFVNGKRIVFPAPNEMAMARRGIKPSGSMTSQGGRKLPGPKIQSSSADVNTIMAEIKPEHIEEMNYEDCFSSKVEGMHTSSALFVVLKPGIGFEDGIGSYVVPERDADLLAPKATVASVPSNSSPTLPTASPLAAYHARLLGVYDMATGEPLDSVSVTDAQSGTTALTTKTGTVTLAFLPDGASTLRINKPGYAEMRMDVSISPRDTTPITLVLTKPQ